MIKSLKSFKNAIILVFFIIISFAAILIVLSDDPTPRTIFGDLAAPIIEFLVIIVLFHAAKQASDQGRRVQIAWSLILAAFLSYIIGDIIWAVLELVLNENLFPSVADIFYLSLYPLFALGIYFLPRKSLNRSEEFKIILEMGIVIATVGLIYWVFLLNPTISNNENFFYSIISAIYIIGDFILFSVLIRLFYSRYEKEFYGPLIFLSLGVMVLIFTDSTYYLQTLQGTYVSGGLLDLGWILSFLLVGLAAFLQASKEKHDFKYYLKLRTLINRYNLASYLPLIWVMIAFVILTWANWITSGSNLVQIEIGLGIIIFLSLIRQAIIIKENENLYTGAKDEIKHRKKIENNLKESEQRLLYIINFLPDATFAIDNQGKIIAWNRAVEEVTGIKTEDMIGKGNYEYSIPWYGERRPLLIDMVTETPEEINAHYPTATKQGDTVQAELDITLNENEKTFWVKIVPLYDSEGNITGAIETLRDTTEKNLAEKSLERSLLEKELLLKEVHHRVKNNMQIISSLLNLESANVYDKRDAELFFTLQNRVKSMALIHNNLYSSDDISSIKVKAYINSLSSQIFATSASSSNINLVTDIDDITLNMETAIPLGLIINELVTNSFKYAFPQDKGTIQIQLKQVDGELELIIADDGIGIPKDKNQKATLGLQLVDGLVMQLDGNITREGANGTKYAIKFKEIKYKKRF
jgi:two-component system, sensor histidine kinase PdtaS